MTLRPRDLPPTEGLRDVYRDNVKAVYAYFAYLVPADTAEELTAATFERVVRYWRNFDPARGRSRLWVLAIARHVLADHFHRAGQLPEVSLDEYPHLAELAATNDGPDTQLEAREGLRSWLDRLNDRQREVIALRFGADLSPAEIAVRLGLSEPNVYQIISRSLRRLREELHPDDELRTVRQIAPRG